jgi:phosphatidate cytidylyltransferase
MLSQRVKAAFIFVPLILFFMFIGGWAFNAFIAILLTLAAIEYRQVCQKFGYDLPAPILLLGVSLFIIQRWFFVDQYLGLTLTTVIIMAAVTALVQYERGQTKAALNFTLLLSGILYLGWVGTAFIALRALPYGRGWMLTALPSVWLADSGAYSIGRRWGKSKMTPHTSPNKSWEGFAAAVITGTVSGGLLLLLCRTINFLPAGTPVWQGALLGFVLSVLTPIGDFLISLFKRSANVKDTGGLIPGHGGILDRIDTWIWAALLGYYLVKLFQ